MDLQGQWLGASSAITEKLAFTSESARSVGSEFGPVIQWDAPAMTSSTSPVSLGGDLRQRKAAGTGERRAWVREGQRRPPPQQSACTPVGDASAFL